jgi:hypothetical protein
MFVITVISVLGRRPTIQRNAGVSPWLDYSPGGTTPDGNVSDDDDDNDLCKTKISILRNLVNSRSRYNALRIKWCWSSTVLVVQFLGLRQWTYQWGDTFKLKNIVTLTLHFMLFVVILSVWLSHNQNWRKHISNPDVYTGTIWKEIRVWKTYKWRYMEHSEYTNTNFWKRRVTHTFL